MDNPRIWFIGAGTLARGLALGLTGKGCRVVAASSRTFTSAEALADRIPGCRAVASSQGVADGFDLVFITTPDEAIGRVVSQLLWREGQGVVHCSGAESLDTLAPAIKCGATIGSFHPYQTFACLDGMEAALERLQAVTFKVDGSGWVRSFLERLASLFGGRAISLRSEDGALYHASGVLACGYLVTLMQAYADMLKGTGLSEDEAMAAVLPLAKATLDNVSHAGAQASITGPHARGDTVTLRKHLEALESRLPRLLPLYCHLSLESLPNAVGISDPSAQEAMEHLIESYLDRSYQEPRRSRGWPDA